MTFNTSSRRMGRSIPSGNMRPLDLLRKRPCSSHDLISSFFSIASSRCRLYSSSGLTHLMRVAVVRSGNYGAERSPTAACAAGVGSRTSSPHAVGVSYSHADDARRPGSKVSGLHSSRTHSN
jgi:hypothetical protein